MVLAGVMKEAASTSVQRLMTSDLFWEMLCPDPSVWTIYCYCCYPQAFVRFPLRLLLYLCAA